MTLLPRGLKPPRESVPSDSSLPDQVPVASLLSKRQKLLLLSISKERCLPLCLTLIQFSKALQDPKHESKV